MTGPTQQSGGGAVNLYRVTSPGMCAPIYPNGAPEGYPSAIAENNPNAVLISLPPVEVELGTLESGCAFQWLPSDSYAAMFPDPRVVDHSGESTRLSYRSGKRRIETYVFSEVRVLRVPPPTSAGSASARYQEGRRVPP